MYLALRTRFLHIHENLSPHFSEPNWEASDPKDKVAVERYWNHTFDEWFLSTQLKNTIMLQLWDKYFSNAILGGLRHNGLRKVLIDMTREDRELANNWKKFRMKLDELWAVKHPSDGTMCKGIECNHKSV